jgi:hypothetical protein
MFPEYTATPSWEIFSERVPNYNITGYYYGGLFLKQSVCGPSLQYNLVSLWRLLRWSASSVVPTKTCLLLHQAKGLLSPTMIQRMVVVHYYNWLSLSESTSQTNVYYYYWLSLSESTSRTKVHYYNWLSLSESTSQTKTLLFPTLIQRRICGPHYNRLSLWETTVYFSIEVCGPLL